MAEDQDKTIQRIVEVAPPTQQQIIEERKGQHPITRPDTITRPRGRSGTIPFLSTSPGSLRRGNSEFFNLSRARRERIYFQYNNGKHPGKNKLSHQGMINPFLSATDQAEATAFVALSHFGISNPYEADALT